MQAPFDSPAAVRLSEAKKAFLGTLVTDLLNGLHIATALDVGCGFGYFSGYLKELGLKVRAFDGRPENVTEARKRYQDIEFLVYDVEDPSIASLGQFDLVLCFGVLYHLENPFRAIRNLFSVTGKVLLVESVIVPGRSLSAFLYEEGPGQDQGLAHIALMSLTDFR